MTEIDWSKAPEGAQYYCYRNGLFYKFDAAGYGLCTRPDGSWFPCADKDDYEPWELTPIPPSPVWSGEGLPPVGARIEWFSPIYAWLGGRVVGHDGTVTVVVHNDGYTGCHPHEIRPVRTPEQIAAEEREKTVDALCYEIIMHYGYPKNAEAYRALATKLHDAGYRKTEG